MKRSLMSGVLIVFLSISSTAQGLYKLQYYGDRNIVYDALLAWYGPGQPSMMRIMYYEPIVRGPLFVEQSIFFIPRPDGFVLKGSNARFALPAPSDYTFSPDSFVFARCPNGAFPCVTTVDDVGQFSALLEFRPVAEAEAETLLRRFGFLTTNANAIPKPGRTSSSRVTMHLIVVADTDASDIGVNDEIDANGIVREFQIAANEIGIGFDPVIISGSAFSRRAIMNALNGLDPSPNDIVVFAYTGHGFRLDSDTDPYPRLNFARNRRNPAGENLPAWEVFTTLKQKGARLNLTLVDACNNRLEQSKLTLDPGYSLKNSASGISPSAAAKLFLETRGNIIVAAARKGQLAGTDKENGGYFTRSFLNALRAETSLVYGSDPSWESIIKDTGDAAFQISRKTQGLIYHIE